MYLYLLIILMLSALALLVIHAKRLITVSIALASLSALTATLLYLGGASTAAVIELSVGAGLVAVLFTFANSLLAERNDILGAGLPRFLALILAAITFGLLLVNSLGFAPMVSLNSNPNTIFWEERGADIVALMALMFSAVLGVLALLAERELPVHEAAKEGV